MDSWISAFVWRDLITAVFWLAVTALAVGTARRAALWRAGRPASVAWSGLLAIPKRYFVDLHDVVAREPVPPFANTAMDGYAIRAADVAAVPVTLPVVAEVAAGHPAPRTLQPGEAMRIFTGAPMPEGADAVVMVERTERLDDGRAVRIDVAVDPGTHLRAAGEDLKPGERVLSAGDEVTPARIGVLASLGVAEVRAVGPHAVERGGGPEVRDHRGHP